MSDGAARSGARTLLLSVLLSSTGPLVVGLGLLAGHSSTQVADFVRRTAELLAIIASFAVFRVTAREGALGTPKAERLERISNAFVGTMMCVAAAFMVLLALASEDRAHGNVIPGLAIAILGVIANGAFWLRYTRLNRREPHAIMRVQARLYRAKTLVDACVTGALLSVVIAPGSDIAHWLDRAGSLAVAVYLAWCGAQTIWEARTRMRVSSSAGLRRSVWWRSRRVE